MSVQPSVAGPCVGNMVPVGTLCVDQYEAIVVPFRPDFVIGTLEGKQFGRTGDDYPCADNGNNCSANQEGRIYAASFPGVTPSRFITWFQAQQACANVGKRLLRNGEWQMATAGTPDYSGRGLPSCNVTSSAVALTGSYQNCVANRPVFDMVGNVAEWVEDWIQPNTGSNGVNFAHEDYGGDMILGIDDASIEDEGVGFPGALIRGGHASSGSAAGVFWLIANFVPSGSASNVGFRCARER